MRNFAKTVMSGLVAALATAVLVPGVSAQEYPDQPVRIINPWTAGGPADLLARPLAEELSKALGQPVVVENRSGANGTIGADAVAKSEPDGYTILFSHVGPIAISPAVQAEMPYDSMEDFDYIGLVATGSLMLAVRPDLPVESVDELIAYAKENPGLTYGSVGIGSTVHLAGELLKMETGIDIVHVPYKGAAPVIADILGGRIDFTFLNVAALLPYVESGELRGLAVTTLERSPQAPDLPTISETIPDYNVASWYGLAAPAGTPEEIVERLSQEVADILSQPEMSKRIEEAGLRPEGTSPQEHTEQVQRELNQWKTLVEAAGINPE